MKNANVSRDRRISVYLCEISAAAIDFKTIFIIAAQIIINMLTSINDIKRLKQVEKLIMSTICRCLQPTYSVNVFPHKVPH